VPVENFSKSPRADRLSKEYRFVLDVLRDAVTKMARVEAADQPIEERHRGKMRILAEALDLIFNEDGTKETAFCLLVAPFGEDPDGRVNYISNAQRKDMLDMMRAYLKQQPEAR
jgi:hypothetical protein